MITSSSTILVVEDETLTRLMLVTEMEGNGHSVIEAADADQAREPNALVGVGWVIRCASVETWLN